MRASGLSSSTRSPDPHATPMLAAAPKPALTGLAIDSAPDRRATATESSVEALSTTITRASLGSGSRAAGSSSAEL